MALTALDPQTALIVVDLQKGIVAYPMAHPIKEIVSRARSLADAFRARGLPVVLVNVAGSAPGRTEIPRNIQMFAPAVGYGLLSSIMAAGAMSGALLAAGSNKPGFRTLAFAAAIFGLGFALAAVAPGYWLFAGALAIIGAAALAFSNATNSLMQLSTEPEMRGRVMAIRVAIALGGTPLGAPVVGWVADRFGPRWALAVGAGAGVVAAIVAVNYLRRERITHRRTLDQIPGAKSGIEPQTH